MTDITAKLGVLEATVRATERGEWFVVGPEPPTVLALIACARAAKKALHEMRHTVAPRNRFTDVVDELDDALSSLSSVLEGVGKKG